MARKSRAPSVLVRSSGRARTREPSAPRSCTRATRAASASRCGAPCAVVYAALSGRLPGSHRQTGLPPSASIADVPASSAASAARSRSLRGPSAGGHSVSWPPPRSSRSRTRTLDGSVRITPPWLSSPTSPLRSGYARIRVPVRLEGGPNQTAELGQIRIPKSPAEWGLPFVHAVALP